MKKRYLKKGIEKALTYYLLFYITYLSCTIETIELPFNQIISYIILTSIFSLIALLSFILLLKYGRMFEE